MVGAVAQFARAQYRLATRLRPGVANDRGARDELYRAYRRRHERSCARRHDDGLTALLKVEAFLRLGYDLAERFAARRRPPAPPARRSQIPGRLVAGGPRIRDQHEVDLEIGAAVRLPKFLDNPGF